MSVIELERVLTLSRHERFDYLARLSPSDADAISLLIDDCLIHRWPKTVTEWIAFSDLLSNKHMFLCATLLSSLG